MSLQTFGAVLSVTVFLAGGPGLALAADNSSTSGAAQSDVSTPQPPPSLQLTQEQRQVFYTSVSSKTHKSTAAPPDFLPKLGASVPPSVEVQPIPETVVELVPALRGYVCAMVANQALIIDPKSQQIIEIVGENPAGGVSAPRT